MKVRRAQTLREVILLLDDDSMKTELLASINDIVVETPLTKAAAQRFATGIQTLGDCNERDELRTALAIAAVDSALKAFKVV